MASPQRPQTPADHERAEDERLTQRAMLDACQTGDVLKLQQLFKATCVRKGDPPVEPHWISYPDKVEPVPASGPAATSSMIWTAVRYKQPETLALLLATYPEAHIQEAGLLKAAFAHPHLETFKLLHHHCPSIVTFDDFPCHETALMEACRGGNPLIPNYLLDNGADPNEGGIGFMGPLSYAVTLGQPLEFIIRLVNAGAHVLNFSVIDGIRQQRPDVVSFLLNRCWFECRMEGLRDALKEAHEMKNKETIALIEKQIKEENARRTRAEEEESSTEDDLWEMKEASVDKRWWRFWR